MKRMMKHTRKVHGRPLTIVPRVPHPRAAGVLAADAGDFVEMPWEPTIATVLTGGDLDADWQRAWDSGDEAAPRHRSRGSARRMASMWRAGGAPPGPAT